MASRKAGLLPGSRTAFRRKAERQAARAVAEPARRVCLQYARSDRSIRKEQIKKAGKTFISPGPVSRSRRAALLSDTVACVPHRVRQYAERREPHSLGLARLQRRLRSRPPENALRIEPPVGTPPRCCRFARDTMPVCRLGHGECFSTRCLLSSPPVQLPPNSGDSKTARLNSTSTV